MAAWKHSSRRNRIKIWSGNLSICLTAIALLFAPAVMADDPIIYDSDGIPVFPGTPIPPGAYILDEAGTPQPYVPPKTKTSGKTELPDPDDESPEESAARAAMEVADEVENAVEDVSTNKAVKTGKPVPSKAVKPEGKAVKKPKTSKSKSASNSKPKTKAKKSDALDEAAEDAASRVEQAAEDVADEIENSAEDVAGETPDEDRSAGGADGNEVKAADADKYSDVDHLFGCWYHASGGSPDYKKPINITAAGPLVSADLVWRNRTFSGAAEGGTLTLDYKIKGVSDLSDPTWWQGQTTPPKKVVSQVAPLFPIARYVFKISGDPDKLEGVFKGVNLLWGKEDHKLTKFERFDRPWTWVRDHKLKVTSVHFMKPDFSGRATEVMRGAPLHIEARASSGCAHASDRIEIEIFRDDRNDMSTKFVLTETGMDTKIFRSKSQGLTLPPIPGLDHIIANKLVVLDRKSLKGDVVDVSALKLGGTAEKKTKKVEQVEEDKDPPVSVKSIRFLDYFDEVRYAFKHDETIYLEATATGGDKSKPDTIHITVSVNDKAGSTETNLTGTLIETGPDTGIYKQSGVLTLPPIPGRAKSEVYDHMIAQDVMRRVSARAELSVSGSRPGTTERAAKCEGTPPKVFSVAFKDKTYGTSIFEMKPSDPLFIEALASDGCPTKKEVVSLNISINGLKTVETSIVLTETGVDTNVFRSDVAGQRLPPVPGGGTRTITSMTAAEKDSRKSATVVVSASAISAENTAIYTAKTVERSGKQCPPILIPEIRFTDLLFGETTKDVEVDAEIYLEAKGSGGCPDKIDRIEVVLSVIDGVGNRNTKVVLTETGKDTGLFRSDFKGFVIPPSPGVTIADATGYKVAVVDSPAVASVKVVPKPAYNSLYERKEPSTLLLAPGDQADPERLGPVLAGWSVDKLKAEKNRLNKIYTRIGNGENLRVYRMTYEYPEGDKFDRIELSETPDLEPDRIRMVTPNTFLKKSELLKSVERTITDLDKLIEQKGG